MHIMGSGDKLRAFRQDQIEKHLPKAPVQRPDISSGVKPPPLPRTPIIPPRESLATPTARYVRGLIGVDELLETIKYDVWGGFGTISHDIKTDNRPRRYGFRTVSTIANMGYKLATAEVHEWEEEYICDGEWRKIRDEKFTQAYEVKDRIVLEVSVPLNNGEATPDEFSVHGYAENVRSDLPEDLEGPHMRRTYSSISPVLSRSSFGHPTRIPLATSIPSEALEIALVDELKKIPNPHYYGHDFSEYLHVLMSRMSRRLKKKSR